MAYTERDGTRIRYQITGMHNAGVPLMLSHGYAASSAMWDPNIAVLAAARPVITWDLRGHGRSGCPGDPGEYTHAACVADMAAVLDAAGISRAVIGGLSLGGYLSLAFCLSHPRRVAALLLCDTGPGFRSDVARRRWNDRALALADRLERNGLAALGDSPEVRAAEHHSARGLALAARGMLTQQDARVIEALPSITVPTLILAGADDRAYLAAADYLAAKITGAVRAVIPGAGHACNLDQPEPFNRQVLAFLEQLDRR